MHLVRHEVSQRDPSLTREILSYLLEHPEAQDTVEGIAEWWILERSIRRRLSEVQDALGELVERDLLKERKGRSTSPVRYQVNRERLAQIREILDKE